MSSQTLSPLAAASPLLQHERRWSLRSVALLFLAWLILQIGGLFTPGLLDDVDSVYVEVAREMLQRHDFVTPYADGIRFFDKPPLMYWLAAGSMKIFGPHDWAARLPLALLALALLLAVYALGLRLFGEKGGFYSALVVATSAGPYLFTRFFIPDLLLALWMTLSVHLFLRILDEVRQRKTPSRTACWSFAAIMALNVLTKGLIGLVFPVGVVLVYLGITRQLKLLARMRLASSTIVFLAIAAPWHVLAALRNPAVALPSGLGLPATGGWFWFYIVNEHFMRFLGRRIPHDYGQVPLFAFWLLALLWLAPWAVFLPGAIRDSLRTLRHRANSSASFSLKEHQTALILAIWALVVLGFFSLSSRQEYYSLPALPALALMIGGLLAREDAPPEADLHSNPHAGPFDNAYPLTTALSRRSALFASKWLLLPLCLSIAAVCAWFAFRSATPRPGADIFLLLQQHPQDYTLSLGHFFDLTTAAMGLFRIPLIGVATAMFAGSLGALLLRRKRHYYAANLTLAAAMCINLVCAHTGLVVFYPILGSKPLAIAINDTLDGSNSLQEAGPNTSGGLILLDGEYTSGSSINFYTRQQVHLVNGRMNGTWYGSFWPDAPPIFETDASLHRLWATPQRIFLVTTNPLRASDLLPYGPVILRATSGGKTLLTNHPVD